MASRKDPKFWRDLRLMKGIATGKGFQCLIQVTNRCNMRCGFCEFWSNPAHPRDELTLDDFQRISDGLARESSYVISVEGGEPFLRKDLVEIIEIFSAKHHTVLYTNGWHVTRENARKLFDAGLEHAAVSIDFPGPRHAEVRGVEGAYERAVEAVKIFKELAPRGGRQVHVMSILMKENADQFEELLQLSKSLGVGHMTTLLSQKGFRRGKAPGSNMPDPEVAKKLLELKRKYPQLSAYSAYLRGMEPFLSGQEMPVCRAGVRSFNIDHLGGVSVCIEKIDQILGNVRQEPWEAIRAKLIETSKSEKIATCQDCWTLCRGFNQVYDDLSFEKVRELLALS